MGSHGSVALSFQTLLSFRTGVAYSSPWGLSPSHTVLSGGGTEGTGSPAVPACPLHAIVHQGSSKHPCLSRVTFGPSL